MEAWIAGGGKFLIQAWKKLEAPLTFDAIKEAPFTFTFTMDAARFDFGTQERWFTMDAVIAPVLSELHVTQLGWLQPGRLMWGDVTPEYEQLHFSIAAVVTAILTNSFTIDAYLEAPYLPEVLESVLGDMQLGEDGLGWAQKAFSIDAVIFKNISETFTADAYFVKGFFRIDAVTVLGSTQSKWNYEYARTGDWAPNTHVIVLRRWEDDY
jgi:hypothetical protein